MLTLGTVAEEEETCRAAFAAVPEAKYAVHVHHETPVERLTEPPEKRIAHILAEKPEAERALRLRLFRPVSDAAWAEYWPVSEAAYAEFRRVRDAAVDEFRRLRDAALTEYERARDAAHDEYHRVRDAAHRPLCIPDCPHDGKSIFGRGKK